MIVKISEDELYPMYDLASYGEECEVAPEKAAEWSRVLADYNRVQEEMRDVLESTRRGKAK